MKISLALFEVKYSQIHFASEYGRILGLNKKIWISGFVDNFIWPDDYC